MAKITVKGLDDIQKKLKANATLADVKKVVRKNGAEMQKKMQKNADFKGHYEWEKGTGKVKVSPTGETKRSIGLEITDGGLTAESGPETEYAPCVEWGTRFMEAQPFIRPAFEEQKKKFQNDLRKLMR